MPRYTSCTTGRRAHAAALLLFGLLPIRTQAQPNSQLAQVDSLRQVLARPNPPDSTRLYLLQRLAQPDDANPVYARQGAALARRLGRYRFEAYFLVRQGQLAKGTGDYVLATARFQQALLVVEKGQLYSWPYRTKAELGLADVAGAEEEYLTAAQHSRQALRYAHQITTNSPKDRLLLESVSLVKLLDTYTHRLERVGPADSLRTRIRHYGALVVGLGRQMQAAGFTETALGIRGNWWQSSSDLYASEGQLDSALVVGERAAAAFRQVGALASFATVQQHLINVEAKAGQHARAVARAREIIALAHEMQQPLLEADCLASLALSLDALGDGRGAYRASARATTLHDSLMSSEKREAVSRLQVRFDTERQRTRVRELTQQQLLMTARAARQRQQLWTWLVALGAGLALLGTYLWQRAAAARRAADLRLRTRLAADLHDEVGALLTRVTMRTELLQADTDLPQLADLLAESRSAASTVRDIIWSVNTTTDTVGALVDRLHDLLDQTTRATAWTTHFDLTPAPLDLGACLRPEVRQHTYLICKEAITNALKHGSGGAHLRLTLHLHPDVLTLTVDNDGPPAAATPARAGQGQRNMAYRAQLLGGILASAPAARGWQVALRVPRPLA